MLHFGLIGKKLAHSFSADWFNAKFKNQDIDAEYSNYELKAIDDFPALIRSVDFSGLNVTVPYKKQIISFLDSLNETAEKAGAVNVVQFSSGILIGFNTDYPAFRDTIKAYVQPGQQALILGSGGSAGAVKAALNELDIHSMIVSRNPDQEMISYSEAVQRSAECDIIINCTPIGMYPDLNAMPPLNSFKFRKGQIVYDLIYNPEKTMLLQKAEDSGAKTMNGLSMLHQQAELSWKIWMSAKK